MKTVKERLLQLCRPLYKKPWHSTKCLRGLTEEQVEENRDLYGENVITKGQDHANHLKKILPSLLLTFTVILL